MYVNTCAAYVKHYKSTQKAQTQQWPNPVHDSNPDFWINPDPNMDICRIAAKMY